MAAPEPHPAHAPTNVGWQVVIAKLALQFFHFTTNQESWAAIGKKRPSVIQPLTAAEFIRYLHTAEQHADAWPMTPHVLRLLGKMTRVGLLEDHGIRLGSPGGIGNTYLATRGLPASQASGDLWLAEALGPEHVIRSYGSVTVAVTGTRATGDLGTGTGLVVSPRHILTCAHVVHDMAVDEYLERPRMPPPVIWGFAPFGRLLVSRTYVHDSVDVAVLEVDSVDMPTRLGRLATLEGVAYRDPAWADQALVFGFPPVPTTTEAPLIVQRGEVVNPNVATWSTDGLFLFSSIARPGHSGGPIVAQDGRVIGLATRQLTMQDPGPDDAPYYAGLKASAIHSALDDLGLGHLIALEDWS